jgi:hypothetical protein
VGIHALKLLSLINKSVERRSISKEVAHIISTSFATYLHLGEASKATVKWGDVDDAVLDFQEKPAHYGIERAGDTTMKTLQGLY